MSQTEAAPRPAQKIRRALLSFIEHEASSGIILLAAAALALIISNSALAWLYDGFLSTPVSVQIGALRLDKPLLLWINDGLMAVFFLLVGLEIKREIMVGQLSSVDRAALPFIAAVGGMVAPALVYLGVTGMDEALIRGWAIPAATDIAFALGVLALLGSRVPVSLKVFLLALAIIDDLGAIMIIAVFYTENLSGTMLIGAAVAIAALAALNLRGVRSITPYVLIGVVMWVFVLKSGVHATLAGVALAFAIPISGSAEDHSPLEKMEHGLHPWVAYMIMPVFAFANAGVSLAGFGPAMLLEPLSFGIASGLVVGKIVGIIGAVGVAVALGITRLPDSVSWPMMVGVAALAGIGFTMSLFIGTLAFADPSAAAGVRIGVLSGSLVSALLGYVILARTLPSEAAKPASA